MLYEFIKKMLRINPKLSTEALVHKETYKVTEEHSKVMEQFSKQKETEYQEFYRLDSEELVLKCGQFQVVREYEEGEPICYTLYKGMQMVMVLYKEDVPRFLRSGKYPI